MKTVKRGDAILIPVTTEPHFDLAPFRARLEEHIDLPHRFRPRDPRRELRERLSAAGIPLEHAPQRWERIGDVLVVRLPSEGQPSARLDRKSTRLNSSHVRISYAVFCLKKKKTY